MGPLLHVAGCNLTIKLHVSKAYTVETAPMSKIQYTVMFDTELSKLGVG